MDCLTLVTANADETHALGAALARVLAPGTLVLLRGQLGAGKTTLAQGIAAGLGVDGLVISPTFVLVREYEGHAGGPGLVHMDFYRLAGTGEALDLGFSDYLAGDDIVVVEWPERAGAALPAEALEIELDLEASGRRLTFRARGADALGALAALAAVAATRP